MKGKNPLYTQEKSTNSVSENKNWIESVENVKSYQPDIHYPVVNSFMCFALFIGAKATSILTNNVIKKSISPLPVKAPAMLVGASLLAIGGLGSYKRNDMNNREAKYNDNIYTSKNVFPIKQHPAHNGNYWRVHSLSSKGDVQERKRA